MPDNSAAIGAGLEVGSQIANALLTGARNKKQYERSIAFWKLQNVYNSPEEQMKRFQRAGLNPNLIYGNGTSTIASAPENAPIETPRFSLGGVADRYYNIEQRKLQTDNLKAQNTVMLEEALLKRAQTRATLANAGLGEFNLGFKSEMRDTSAEFLREQLRQAHIRNLSGDQDLLFKDATMQDRIKGVGLTNDLRSKQLSNIEQNILNAQQRYRLNQFEEDLNKNGITKSDAVYWRLLDIFLKGFGISLK